MDRAAPAGADLYCGDPIPPLRSFLRRDPAGGVLCLFRGLPAAFTVNARAAIRKVCDLFGLGEGSVILAPAYNCGSEIDPLLHAGAAVQLYPVDRTTVVHPGDIEARLSPRVRAVYLTHYFGFAQPHAAAIKELCARRRLVLIEDCALRLLDARTAALPAAVGDASIYCFYKFFPVAGGGALVLNSGDGQASVAFDRPPPPAFAARAALRAGLGALLGPRGATRAFSRLNRGLSRLRRRKAAPPPSNGEADPRPDMPASYYFDARLKDARISALARRPLRFFDVAGTIRRRRANYEAYFRHLSGVAGVAFLFPQLADDVCPLSMPIVVGDRDALAAALNERGIGATLWWAGYHRRLSWDGCADACFLKDHVLSLPCHQFMGEEHVAFIAGEVRRLLGR